MRSKDQSITLDWSRTAQPVRVLTPREPFCHPFNSESGLYVDESVNFSSVGIRHLRAFISDVASDCVLQRYEVLGYNSSTEGSIVAATAMTNFAQRVRTALQLTPNRDGDSDKADFSRTIRFFLTILVPSLVAVALHYWWPATIAAVTWALACFVSGGLLGFLFGVPKVLQSDSAMASGVGESSQSTSSIPRAATSYRQQVNTNLTEISDWLTKIIVGIGLIQLKELPGFTRRAAGILASNLRTAGINDPLAYALAVTVGFFILGFLFSYLSTRLFLAGALSRADRSALATEQRVESASAEVTQVRGELDLMRTQLEEIRRLHKDGRTTLRHPASDRVDRPIEAEGGEEADIDWQNRLLELANKYLSVEDPDWATRTRLKDRAADEIASFCLTHNVPRDWLADQGALRHNDGLIVALATIVNSSPERPDVDRLGRVGSIAQWKHTRYRVALAIGRVFSAKIARVADLDRFIPILTQYYREGDTPLQSNVRRTFSQISEAIGQPITLS